MKRFLEGSGVRCTPQRYAVMAYHSHPTAAEIFEAVNRFDAKGMRHHHFICDECGNVEDMGVVRRTSACLGVPG